MAETFPFERFGIWQRSLGERPRDRHKKARAGLRASYETFWENTRLLVSRIAADFKDLTLHDEAHLAALWQTADTIAGPKYDLTPAEAFVFGGAILLHDAALTVCAYPGGRSELLATTEWADAVAAESERKGRPAAGTDWAGLDPDIRTSALFALVRKIHAKQAERMAEFSVQKDGNTYCLLEDNTLRNHYGWLIGQIAASHHWSIEDVETRLQEQVNPIADLPEDWTIDPIKLACLLRCADAAQIDQRRAPDFLYALLKLRGVSEQHWRAQNRLAKPVPYQKDRSALLYTSTKPFSDRDADVWWLAYDLVTIVHRELQSCDKLLRETGRPPFAISRVRDAEAPTRLKEHIRVDGWSPVAAEVKVTDLSHLVSTVGGRELYGDDSTIPLRELIQNASDAVRARRMRDAQYVGKISLGLEPDETGEHFWIHVEDDGIGMSERVLIGPLLDFGKSFWKSDLVESEFPGLRSSGYKSVGQFGIGFFSVFMIADTVYVTSRRYDAGTNTTRRLEFRKGLALRPILVIPTAAQLPPSSSTRVSFHVQSNLLKNLLTEHKSFVSSEGSFSISLHDRVARIAAGLDVDVYVSDYSGATPALAHSRQWANLPARQWLDNILCPKTFDNPEVEPFLEELANRVRLIQEDDGRIVGRGAIMAPHERYGAKISETFSFPDVYASLLTVGGLATSRSLQGVVASVQPYGDIDQFQRISEAFIGVLEVSCEGAARSAGRPLAARHTLLRWLNEQTQLILSSNLLWQAKSHAGKNIAAFGGDPRPLCHIGLVEKWLNQDSPLDTQSSVQIKAISRAGFVEHINDKTRIIFICDFRNNPGTKGLSDEDSSELVTKRFIAGELHAVLRRYYVFNSTKEVLEGLQPYSIFCSPHQYSASNDIESLIVQEREKSIWMDSIRAAWKLEPTVRVLLTKYEKILDIHRVSTTTS